MKAELREIEKRQREWEAGTLKESLEKLPEREVYGELPKQRLYTPLDVANLDYLRDLGFPGEYPYVRGVHPTMYRSRFWTIAQYSGFGSPEDTNQLYKFLLGQGQGGLSMACDLPTQLGYDPDHPAAEGNVGVVGVSCPSLREMETIFDGIPLDRVSLRTSTNAPHIVYWAMYFALAQKRGISLGQVTGSIFSDCLEEYISRGNYIFPPKHALRLSCDVIEYCTKYAPRMNFMIHPYTIREGGCTLVQELAFGLANTAAIIEACLERGLNIDNFAPKLTLNFSVHTDLFEEAAKFRAARRLWAKTMKERFGAKKPASLICRSGPGTGGATLTAQQALNNIVRVAIEALAAILGGVQYLHTSSFDEAYAIPTEQSVTIAVRTQQILAYETGIADVVDPLGGSYYVESLTTEIEQQVVDYLKQIDAVGGIVKAVEEGWAQREVTRSAYQQQRDIEEGKKVIVGVNKFPSDAEPTFAIHRADPNLAQEMKQRLQKLKAERDNDAVRHSLAQIREVARSKENLMPVVLDAVRNYATMGEICDVLRDVFGMYEAPSIF